ncbi:MAG TPA: carboxypeptidase-like regulatory domain-containing protein [Polyangia bacterium]|nr:carboxypeptidase-like regulatory domain-containing protein [Polyangia bacterium]
MRVIILAHVVLLTASFAACEDASQPGGGDDDDDDGNSDGDSDGDGDADADGDADGDTDATAGSLHGSVLAPNGTTPIAGALVYLTQGDAPVIPGEIYCYECDDMTGKKWTLSGPDGGFLLETVPAGQWNIVTRKGMFQRQRAITATGDPAQDVPVSLTTLPGQNSADGLDRIPRYAVLLNTWDRSHDLLAKLGLGTLNASGGLVYGTEQFDIYNDAVTQPGYPASSTLVQSDATLHGYHMVFFPCTSDANAVSFVQGKASMLRTYVSLGGKIYNSCCTALWTEQPFPEYVEFYGNDAANLFDIGRITSFGYSTNGKVEDEDMRAWLSVVTASDPDWFPFTDGYVKIDGLVPTSDGHGLEEDGYWVIPKAWVTDQNSYPGAPLIVTYNFDCGKVFYSVYETSHGSGTAISPQEYVLLYMILEVGVCEGDYVDPE